MCGCVYLNKRSIAASDPVCAIDAMAQSLSSCLKANGMIAVNVRKASCAVIMIKNAYNSK